MAWVDWGFCDKVDTLVYPGPMGPQAYHYDYLIDDDSDNITTVGYPSNTPYHTNQFWLVEAPEGDVPQIDFKVGDNLYDNKNFILVYNSPNTQGDVLAYLEGGESDLSTYDFGYGTNGRIVSDTRHLYFVYTTGFNGYSSTAGGDIDANVTFISE